MSTPSKYFSSPSNPHCQGQGTITIPCGICQGMIPQGGANLGQRLYPPHPAAFPCHPPLQGCLTLGKKTRLGGKASESELDWETEAVEDSSQERAWVVFGQSRWTVLGQTRLLFSMLKKERKGRQEHRHNPGPGPCLPELLRVFMNAHNPVVIGLSFAVLPGVTDWNPSIAKSSVQHPHAALGIRVSRGT